MALEVKEDSTRMVLHQRAPVAEGRVSTARLRLDMQVVALLHEEDISPQVVGLAVVEEVEIAACPQLGLRVVLAEA